ncbi:hypothetical protein RchiOBHm_Chr7g0201951 [Rosa chinensis]|uniref:Uncharacterized protein n=1 Tax=Rosa chinensis TaxID=74649 RepID=A0A2P6P838_ROSCH|nr:hypothetical protein RchiOBHm_Chr7g0201951 [Rosa chinensis]
MELLAVAYSSLVAKMEEIIYRLVICWNFQPHRSIFLHLIQLTMWKRLVICKAEMEECIDLIMEELERVCKS